jgi:hypothetical protein
MGEAKRRKQLDPNFGKPKKAFVTRKDGLTQLGNHGIYCGITGIIIDSAVTEEEAQKCCDYINQQLLKFPLFNPTQTKWREWCDEYQEWTPDAVVLQVERGENSDSLRKITFNRVMRSDSNLDNK